MKTMPPKEVEELRETLLKEYDYIPYLSTLLKKEKPLELEQDNYGTYHCKCWNMITRDKLLIPNYCSNCGQRFRVYFESETEG